ncbi:hypothetical protein BBP40_008819 [Aspergillus hancockii]|nr:hypothetical protein BBP40_008819 [Aspergillus hancockii]
MSTGREAALKNEEENAPPKPTYPEGGLRGWMAVVGGWCLMFKTFGCINAFGIYEAYYKQTFLKNESESTIAWIGSLQVFFMFSAGLISGSFMDSYGPKVHTSLPSSNITHLPRPVYQPSPKR